MSTTFLTASASQTKKAGRDVAKNILKTAGHRGKAAVLGLTGELGGGKTAFTQGLADGLGIKEKILSPTFVILKRFKNFYHLDCYRIQKQKDILDLGFKKIISDPRNVAVVEWADKIKKIMPKETIWINFEFISVKTRKITLK